MMFMAQLLTTFQGAFQEQLGVLALGSVCESMFLRPSKVTEVLSGRRSRLMEISPQVRRVFLGFPEPFLEELYLISTVLQFHPELRLPPLGDFTLGCVLGVRGVRLQQRATPRHVAVPWIRGMAFLHGVLWWGGQTLHRGFPLQPHAFNPFGQTRGDIVTVKRTALFFSISHFRGGQCEVRGGSNGSHSTRQLGPLGDNGARG
mmetsp:Transcript_18291/g.43987  ORF Transcript_18291/g.43987 Transcript_18291/m.43987 type:complete len:203 (-) Transcript_18291:781-1389(-)